jgi:DNA modification methylase
MNAPLRRAEQLTLLQPEIELAQTELTSPKRATERDSASGKSYPYYAGFSEDFVRDVLAGAMLPDGARVLDPWNGSGTTVKAATEFGVIADGFDLNPVMVIVARARLSRTADFCLATGFISDVVGKCLDTPPSMRDGDPLDDWMGAATVSQLRKVVSEALQANSDEYINKTRAVNELVDVLPTWRCLVILAVFRSVKAQLGIRDGSNPTWTTLPEPSARRELDINHVLATVSGEINNIRSILINGQSDEQDEVELMPTVRCASSEEIPLDDNTIDLVVTSPPYCTRIDYAKATLIELAVLGLSANAVDSDLRRALIGTTSIKKSQPERNLAWGATCIGILDYVYSHSSKGSRSYYYKNFLQYFDSMFNSMRELARVCKRGAFLNIVVQESFYKEMKIDLPLILCEMGAGVGLSTQREIAFPVRLSMVNINTRSRRYREHSDVDEKVLILKRD